MIPRGECFGRLRTDGWCNGYCRKWVWEHSNGDPAYPWVEPPSNPLCQQSKFTILDSTPQNPNQLTQTFIPLSSSLNWTSKPLSSHSTYTLQFTLTCTRWITLRLSSHHIHDYSITSSSLLESLRAHSVPLWALCTKLKVVRELPSPRT